MKLLILDEPTSSLNEEDSKMLLDMLISFKKDGMTSIIISHKISEIAYVADRITVPARRLHHRDHRQREPQRGRGAHNPRHGRQELTDFSGQGAPHRRRDRSGGQDWCVHHPVYTEGSRGSRVLPCGQGRDHWASRSGALDARSLPAPCSATATAPASPRHAADKRRGKNRLKRTLRHRGGSAYVWRTARTTALC